MQTAASVALMTFALLLAGSASSQEPHPSRRERATEDRGDLLPADFGVIFDSNRSGSFGIYLLSRNQQSAIPLVDSPEHEMYPDVSDRHGLLVFARTKTTNRLEPGSIWLLERGSNGPRLVTENGTFPTFIGDSRDILFERNRSGVYRWDSETGETEKLFPTARWKSFRRFQIVKPRLSRDGRYLAFTSDRPSAWHAWLVNLESGEARQIAPGCEPTFHPTIPLGVFVDEQRAAGGSGIFSFQLQTLATAPYHDPQTHLSHEYFPSFSQDGKWLLYGACSPEEHSHLDAKYELHLRETAAPGFGKRLTFGSSTNRWPKATQIFDWLPADS